MVPAISHSKITTHNDIVRNVRPLAVQAISLSDMQSTPTSRLIQTAPSNRLPLSVSNLYKGPSEWNTEELRSIPIDDEILDDSSIA